MTTADRIDPVGYGRWGSPAAAPGTVDEPATDGEYVGRHRRHGGFGGRSLSLHRMFYSPRHRRT